jgi:hypothetical protein
MNASRILLALSMAISSLLIVNPVKAAEISDRMILTRNFTNPAVPDELFDGTRSEGDEQPLQYTFRSVLLPFTSEQEFQRMLLPDGYSINIFLLEGAGLPPSDLVRVHYSGSGLIDIEVAFYSDPFPFPTLEANETYSVFEVAGALDQSCPACINIDVQAFPFFTRFNNAHKDAPIPYVFDFRVGSDINPVPEPTTWATMLAGLFGIAAIRGGRRYRQTRRQCANANAQ